MIQKNTSQFQISSPAFHDGEPIPKDFTGEGSDRSPELRWTHVPAGTQSLALICDDPDAPGHKPFVHWVVYNIDPTSRILVEAIPTIERVEFPTSLIQGLNSFGDTGYRGPMPPKGHGWHRYFFKLYALDTLLNLPMGATREELLDEMEGHILSEARLMGKYRRELGQTAA